ncbi:MAG: hypothetical protein COA78_15525 [Blastopirellula sp.]|nr:MAG: hypothetical protein COA78_15525 [Blastopirellula sp.]
MRIFSGKKFIEFSTLLVVTGVLIASFVYFRCPETKSMAEDSSITLIDRMRLLGGNASILSYAIYIENDEQAKLLAEFHNIETLTVDGQLSTSSWKAIAQINTIEHLSLHFQGVQGLKYLNHRPKLTYLNISSLNMTGEELSLLSDATSLKTLNLSSCQALEDSSLEALKELPNLETVILDRSAVGDSGMKHLAQIKNLRSLSLTYTSITDEGLKELKNVPTLRSLNLINTKVTDAGLLELQKFPALEDLSIAGPELSDKGLLSLQKCKQLKALDITHYPSSAKFSKEAVAQLKKALPKLEVKWQVKK